MGAGRDRKGRVGGYLYIGVCLLLFIAKGPSDRPRGKGPVGAPKEWGFPAPPRRTPCRAIFTSRALPLPLIKSKV